MSQEELIQRSQAGDVEAFNQLVLAHQRHVYNLALRMLGRVEAAEDATQDAFLAAFRHIKSYRGPNFTAWLLRIAANACNDQFRRGRRPSVSLDAIVLDPEHPRDFADPSEPSEDYAQRRELGRTIADGLTQLPYDQRLAVVLSDIQGLSYEEMTQVMNCNLGTVKSRLSRGRARLRDILLASELLPSRYRLEK